MCPCEWKRQSHTGPMCVRHHLGITQKAPSPFFFSEFSYVTYIYFSVCLFTSRKHLNTGSETLYYKAKGLRAFLFCSHFAQPWLSIFYSCDALFIVDVYKMATVSAIKLKRPSMDNKGQKVTTTSKADLKSETYLVTYRILAPTRR